MAALWNGKVGDILKNGSKILDACCGSKMFWFDRNNPDVLFADIRKEDTVLCDGRKLVIDPDVISDFRDMDFPDKRFKLVVFDPPHLNSLGKNSWMAKKYGVLDKGTWQDDLARGFSECWRVLDDNGILIFKWSDVDIKVTEILKLFNQKPLFGHRTMINNRTIWMCFMKLDKYDL